MGKKLYLCALNVYIRIDMEYKYLNTIYYPSDLKALPREALPQVCEEVRDFIIQQLSQNPGTRWTMSSVRD